MIEVTTTDGQILGVREIGVVSGYSSGKLAIAHFGLEAVDWVTVTITIRAGESAVLDNVPVDGRLR